MRWSSTSHSPYRRRETVGSRDSRVTTPTDQEDQQEHEAEYGDARIHRPMSRIFWRPRPNGIRPHRDRLAGARAGHHLIRERWMVFMHPRCRIHPGHAGIMRGQAVHGHDADQKHKRREGPHQTPVRASAASHRTPRYVRRTAGDYVLQSNAVFFIKPSQSQSPTSELQ